MFPCIILYSLLFDNPLHDHDTERHGVHTGGVLVDRHVANSGEEVVDRLHGGGVGPGELYLVLLPYSLLLLDDTVGCLHDCVELKHDQAEGGGDRVDTVATLLVPLEALHNNIRTGDEVGSQM